MIWVVESVFASGIVGGGWRQGSGRTSISWVHGRARLKRVAEEAALRWAIFQGPRGATCAGALNGNAYNDVLAIKVVM